MYIYYVYIAYCHLRACCPMIGKASRSRGRISRAVTAGTSIPQDGEASKVFRVSVASWQGWGVPQV